MRIVAGEFRGRTLIAPPGTATRPTADRVRQALFDMLVHAPWGGRDVVDGVRVLDAFAGTGALGLEAVSRGAAHATFIEREPAALAVLRANIARCRAEARCSVIASDALGGRAPRHDAGFALVFLDPPYGQQLIPRAICRLRASGGIAPGAVIVAETARDETLALPLDKLAERIHGSARLTIWREAQRGRLGEAGPKVATETAPG